MRIPLSPQTVELLGPLHNELVRAHADWKLLCQLFDHSQDRKRLLHNAAGGFFARVETTMLHSLASGISRLLDTPGSGQRSNLTIQAILETLADPEHEVLRREMTSLLESAKKMADPILAFRHKRIGHLDRAVALEEAEIEGFNSASVNGVLDYLTQILQTLNALPPCSAHTTIVPYIVGDGHCLAERLLDAEAARALIDAGIIDHEQLASARPKVIENPH